jgi:mono/diheme cytochrome c family protein
MNYRFWFYTLNAALLICFAIAFGQDYNAEWKHYQRQYYKMAADSAQKKADAETDPEKKKLLQAEVVKWKHQPLEIKQVIAKDLGTVDRCITCHVGMDPYTNPTMKNDFKDHPYAAHPKVDILDKNHPFTKYGCTVCHQGQGLATTTKDAHGKVHNWERPMFEGKRVQASCARCHQNFEKLPGAEVAAKGKQLFYQHGCQGCHSINTVGGVVSVDLGDINDKPLERILGSNFAHVIGKDGKPLPEEEWTLQNWVLGHLTNDPMKVTPNDPLAQMNAEPVAPSGMPNFTEEDATGKRELSVDDAEAITTWLLSHTAEQLPYKYMVTAPEKPEPKFASAAEHGKFVFEKYGCAGCHGLHGTKGRRNFNAMGKDQDPNAPDQVAEMAKGREPTLVDTVGTYTHEELVKKIAGGVPASAINRFKADGPVTPLYMPAWKDKIKPQELDDLATWLLTIAKKDESGF